MTKWRGLILALIAFTVAYSAAYEATNWISVYLLDWWDPKFGGRPGNIDFGHMMMPLFVVVAVVSFLFALVFHWPWLQTAQSKPVVWASAGGALLAHSAVFLFNLALRQVDGGAAINVTNWILLLGGTAIFSGCLFALAKSRTHWLYLFHPTDLSSLKLLVNGLEQSNLSAGCKSETIDIPVLDRSTRVCLKSVVEQGFLTSDAIAKLEISSRNLALAVASVEGSDERYLTNLARLVNQQGRTSKEVPDEVICNLPVAP